MSHNYSINYKKIKEYDRLVWFENRKTFITIILSTLFAFMLIFGAIALYQIDATRNLMMVNDIENQKVDKIEQERLFLYR